MQTISKTYSGHDDPTMRFSFSPGSVLSTQTNKISQQGGTVKGPLFQTPLKNGSARLSRVTPRRSNARVECRGTPCPKNGNVAGRFGSLVVVDRQGKDDAAFPLNFDDKKAYFMGRKDDCDIRILVPFVSRQHARLVLEDGSIWLTPLSKNQHTFLNDEPVVESTELIDGDIVSIGGRSFKFVSSSDSQHGHTGAAAASAATSGDMVEQDDDPTFMFHPPTMDENAVPEDSNISQIYPSLAGLSDKFALSPVKSSPMISNTGVRSPLSNVANKMSGDMYGSPVIIKKSNNVKGTDKPASDNKRTDASKLVTPTVNNNNNNNNAAAMRRPPRPSNGSNNSSLKKRNAAGGPTDKQATTPISRPTLTGTPRRKSITASSPFRSPSVSNNNNKAPTGDRRSLNSLPRTPQKSPRLARPAQSGNGGLRMSTPKKNTDQEGKRKSGSFANYMPTPQRKQSAVRKMRSSSGDSVSVLAGRKSLSSTPNRNSLSIPPKSPYKSLLKSTPSRSTGRKSVSFSENLEINCFFDKTETTEEIKKQRSKLEHLLSPRRDAVSQSLGNNLRSKKGLATPDLSGKKRRRSVTSMSPSTPRMSPAAKKQRIHTSPALPAQRRLDLSCPSPSLSANLMLSPLKTSSKRDEEVTKTKQQLKPNVFQGDRFKMSSLPNFSGKLRTASANPFKRMKHVTESGPTPDDEFDFDKHADKMADNSSVPVFSYEPVEKAVKSLEKKSAQAETRGKEQKVVEPPAAAVEEKKPVAKEEEETKKTSPAAPQRRSKRARSKEAEAEKEENVDATATAVRPRRSTRRRAVAVSSEPSKEETTADHPRRSSRRRAAAAASKEESVTVTEKKEEDIVEEPKQETTASVSGLPEGITIDTLHKLRVVDLRPLLQERGLSTSGLKKDLVARLRSALIQGGEGSAAPNQKNEETEMPSPAFSTEAPAPARRSTRRRKTAQPPAPQPTLASTRARRATAAKRSRY